MNGLEINRIQKQRKCGEIMLITAKEWLALSLRNRMLLLKAVAKK